MLLLPLAATATVLLLPLVLLPLGAPPLLQASEETQERERVSEGKEEMNLESGKNTST